MNFKNIKISDDNKKLLIELKNILLVICTIIDFIFIFMISFFDMAWHELVFMSIFDLFVCFLLFINLITIYKKSNDTLKHFIKTHLIDIISIIPFNFIFLRYLAVFRLVRLISVLQLFQIFKVYNLRNYDFGSLKFFIQNRLLKLLSIIILFYILLSSIILTNIDPSFTSFFDSLWYNLVTLTGVGYGDIVPISNEGKMMGIMTIIMGVLFLSIFTAAMSSLYMEKPEDETRNLIKSYVEPLKQKNMKLQETVNKLDNDIESLHEKLDQMTRLVDELQEESRSKNDEEDNIDET